MVQGAKTLVTIAVVTALFLVGEVPAMAGVRLLVIPAVTWLAPGWQGTVLFAAECVVATLLIFVVGCALGWLSVKFNKASQPAKTRLGQWLENRGLDREHIVVRLLKGGEPVGFVLASYMGGAALVGWWYARKADAHAYAKSFGAAAVLALFSGPLWVGAYTVSYVWLGPVLAIAMVVLAIPATLAVRSMRGRRAPA